MPAPPSGLCGTAGPPPARPRTHLAGLGAAPVRPVRPRRREGAAAGREAGAVAVRGGARWWLPLRRTASRAGPAPCPPPARPAPPAAAPSPGLPALQPTIPLRNRQSALLPGSSPRFSVIAPRVSSCLPRYSAVALLLSSHPPVPPVPSYAPSNYPLRTQASLPVPDHSLGSQQLHLQCP